MVPHNMHAAKMIAKDINSETQYTIHNFLGGLYTPIGRIALEYNVEPTNTPSNKRQGRGDANEKHSAGYHYPPGTYLAQSRRSDSWSNRLPTQSRSRAYHYRTQSHSIRRETVG